MFSTLFGPVPSRRLGRSLGVDLVPRKVCSLDCVYCEVGRTTRLTTERREWVPFELVRDELETFFATQPDPDTITFSGSGEPTLHRRIDEVIEVIRNHRPEVPIAVLTNGTRLFDPEVRQALLGATMVLPSLDAGSEPVFRAINRPPPSLNLGRIVEGIAAFRREFGGEIRLEVFILPGINDDEAELRAIRDHIRTIGPDRVQLNTLDRPGTEAGLRGATRAELLRALDVFGLENAEIVSAAADRRRIAGCAPDLEHAVLQTIARRPCTVEDLESVLGLHGAKIRKVLDVLEAEARIQGTREDRGVFYRLRDTR